MNHDTAVSKESADALLEGGEVVGVSGVYVAGDFSVLARQIANLASLRCIGVTRSRLSTLIGVKVSQCGSAVSILRDGLVVKVVDERATLAGETGELDLEDHTGTIGAGHGVDITLHVASIGIRALGKSSVRQSRLVHGSDRVVADNCSISEYASVLSRDAGSSQDGGGN